MEELSEDLTDRLNKKMKREAVGVQLAKPTDITLLAMARYESLKQQHHFVSFEEADKAKTYLSGKVESHSLPLHDFNEEMYRFRKLGHCANPDPTSKGLVFASHHKDLKEKSELEGEVIHPNHQQFLEQLYEDTTTKRRKEITAAAKAMRVRGEGVLGYTGPWAGYGEILSNGELTEEQKEKLTQAEKVKEIKMEEVREQERNF